MAKKPRLKRMARRMLLDPTPSDKTTLELAQERTKIAFDRFDHICVMFSGGKDSTVVLGLAVEEMNRRGRTKPLDVVFYDEEAIPFQTEDYVKRVSEWPEVELRWLALPTRELNGCSPSTPYWYPWAPEDEEYWCRPLPEGAITYKDFDRWDFGPIYNRLSIPESNALLFDPKVHGTVGVMMGIRADESMTRRRSVLRRKEDNWIVPFARESYSICVFPGCEEATATPSSKTCLDHLGMRMPFTDPSDLHNVFKCYPIYDWRTEDVWTYARDYARDRNDAYDMLEMAGLPHFRQRCAPPFGPEPMSALWTFKVCFPELWAKMADRVPGAATAARYARSELYSFGERPSVPPEDFYDERAWKDLIRTLLARHDERKGRLTADRCRVIMARHESKTFNPKLGRGDPIMPDIPHPVTGLSWQFLAMVASRGDEKQRKNPEWQVAQRDDPTKVEIARQRYRDALAIWAERSPQSPTRPRQVEPVDQRKEVKTA